MKLHSEALLWSGGGSGVISLADLEAELEGKRAWDAQGASDREFIKECLGRGIRVFGVVFTAQGYEVEVELDDDESEIISFGGTTGAGKKATWGLNQFYRDRFPKIYRSFREYHPPGRLSLIEREIEKGDFLELSACRDLRGEKSICYWINSTGLEHDYRYTNYFMCKNSPLWMEHLKTIIEVQVDAGFGGVQFDEPALSVEVGGTRAGFCGHCKDRFAAYMVERHGGEFRDFDYGALLRKKGAGVMSELAYFKGMPHWEDWKRWLLVEAKRNFAELVDHARSYAAVKGGQTTIAANFFNWLPHHLALADLVDVFALEYDPGIPPEKTNLIYADISRALDDRKPVTMVPHIALAAHLRERAREGKDVNLLRYLIAEAFFGGGDFMVPYSCIPLTGAGAYYPPVEEISGWLGFAKERREIFRGSRDLSSVAVVLSFPSYFWSFDFLNMPGRHFASLEAITHFLQALGVQYRIVIWGDEEFIRDKDDLPGAGELLILPQVTHITDNQVDRLRGFIERGGRALVCGKFGTRRGDNGRRAGHPFPSLAMGMNRLGEGAAFLAPEDIPLKKRAASRRGGDRAVAEWLSGMSVSPEIRVDVPGGRAPLIRAAEKQGRLIVRLLDPNYDFRTDSFAPVKNAELFVDGKIMGRTKTLLMHTPKHEAREVRGVMGGDGVRFRIPDFLIHAIIEEAE